METKTIDGEKYEVLLEGVTSTGAICLHLRPLPKPKKTLVEIAVNAYGFSEEPEWRKAYYVSAAVFDAIEERLKALEEK